jgi:AI-2 transport protein TqsA
MEQPLVKNPGIQVLNAIAAFIIVVAGLKAASAIVVPFLLAVFISILAASPLLWLQNKGWPLWAALTIIIIGVIATMMLLVLLLGASLDDFTRELPTYQSRLREIVLGIINWAEGRGLEISADRAREVFDPSGAIGIVNNILGGITNLLGNAFLILFTIIFMLVEAASFPRKIIRITGGKISGTYNEILLRVRSYIAVKTMISVATGICIGILTYVIGVDFPVLWGIIGFLLNYVPTIGSILASVPACLVALVQLGIGPTIFTALGYFGINVVFGNLIEPRVMGRAMGLSTLVVFLSLVFWGWVLGPIGMLLSVPLTMVAKIALEQNTQTMPIAIILDADRPAEQDQSA